ncbi:MAG: hypothetical protein CMN30_25655 [Sandaracinus sp.]|nr:hypothetical protein [Sandaracinus sp.]|tara:strand:- start:404 stop:931 length:528 start_codon:yes stop_codon:yes gene_type:complete
MAGDERNHIDDANLHVTGRHSEVPAPHVGIDQNDDGVVIVVTQAFGPKGDNLVGVSDVTFDGYPAVSVGVRLPDGKEGVVHLSPIHGDGRKAGFTEIPKGAKCELFCPVSKEPLPALGEVEDGSGASYRALFLTPKLEDGAVVMISDVWGHFHSRIIDDMELLSYWAVNQEKQGA